MRGKVSTRKNSGIRRRITPAYAGKSGEVGFVKDRPEDHPRLCGEKFLKETFYNGNKGSPPPMRGKVFA